MKEGVHEHKRKLTNDVEVYNYKLETLKEELEKEIADLKKWMRDSHISEKILQKEKKTKDFKQWLDKEVDSFEFTNKLLILSEGVYK